MIITAYFSDAGVPKTGLSPTINIRRVDTAALVVTAGAMSEVGDGFYKYDFSGYDPALEYSILCDGTSSLEGYDRYAIAITSDKTGFSLTSAYDAAKTAAQAGDEMDMVDAPNSTAITAIHNGLATPTNITAGTITNLTNAPPDSSGVTTLLSRIVGTLLTGNHSPQSGDAYAQTNSGTYGLSALKTLIDAIATAPTASAVADAVWDELLSGHTGAGSAGLALSTASSGGVDPSVLADAIWDEALSGHATAGTSGKKLSDLVNADLSGVAMAANLDTVNTVVDAIKTKTDGLNFTGSYVQAQVKGQDNIDFGALQKASITTAATAATPIAAGLTVPNAAEKAAIDSIKAKTDNLPANPAAVGSNMGTVSSVTGSVASVVAAVNINSNSDIAAIKTKTDKMTYTSGNNLDTNIKKVNDVTLTGDGSTTPWGPT